jgi:hypothetical protein
MGTSHTIDPNAISDWIKSNQEYEQVIASSKGISTNKELRLVSRPFEQHGVVKFRVYHKNEVIKECHGYEPEIAVEAYNKLP